MSLVLILTPVIVGSWPAIAAAVGSAAAAMGLAVKEASEDAVRAGTVTRAQQENEVELELAESQVLAETMSADEEIILTRGTVEIRVRRDENGRCSVCAKGAGHTKAELRAAAEEFSQKMTLSFVYNKVMSELRAKGFQIVNEEQMEDESVRIHVRRWES